MRLAQLSTFLFYFFASLTVLSAVLVVKLKNIFKAVLWLGVFFFSSSGLYFLLLAEVPALVQILVYVGGIITLFLFSLMILPRSEESRNSVAFPLIFFLLFLVLIIFVLSKAVFLTYFTYQSLSAADLGTALTENYLLAFELMGLVLLASFVAAFSLLKREEEES